MPVRPVEPDQPRHPLTIAQFTDNYGPAHSGLLYAVQFLEGEVLAAGHKVLLVAPESSGPNPYADHPRRREYRVRSFPLVGAQVRMASLRGFDHHLEELAADPPDVIHVHGLGPVGLLGMRLADLTGKPLVVTWHTDLEAYAEHYWNLVPALNIIYKLYEIHVDGGLASWLHRHPLGWPRRGNAQVELLGLAARMLTRAELVTTPSPKTARKVLEIAPDARVRVMPNGTDALPKREPIDWPAKDRMVYVGRVSLEKGIGLILDAFEKLRATRPEAELMIVGEWRTAQGTLRHRLHHAAEAGLIRLPGQIPREDLDAYYSAANLFIFASTTDTQALVLHEAAHAGLPFVMVDHELRLVVEPGVNAVLAAENAESLAVAMADMLDNIADPDFAATASARSRELAAKYTIANQSREFIEEIYEVLADRRCPTLTTGLNPNFGRPVFPTRRVAVPFRPPRRDESS